eukprot:TRINITY_DN4849_c0_g1_i4.p1 TRINITY_DN4849_c0_g1~~TRINITY_DN4849_c0_g1_i4.p1  ORF type:complete len:149 (+),score=20.72 TRINITY_DN4849_c0_g1_i4:191-637(+)
MMLTLISAGITGFFDGVEWKDYALLGVYLGISSLGWSLVIYMVLLQHWTRMKRLECSLLLFFLYYGSVLLALSIGHLYYVFYPIKREEDKQIFDLALFILKLCGSFCCVLLVFSSLCSQPVSYTHLRAHETSLHLVCRLLLEKKKIKT